MICDKFEKITKTEKVDTIDGDEISCSECEKYWNNGCPYGKQADKNDWEARDPEYGKDTPIDVE